MVCHRDSNYHDHIQPNELDPEKGIFLEVKELSWKQRIGNSGRSAPFPPSEFFHHRQVLREAPLSAPN